MVTERVFIALGANLGERDRTLRAALAQLAETPAIELRRVSAFFETDPVGGPPGQPPYLNAAAELRTTLTPAALLCALQRIERDFGRERSVPNAPRTLDLDLLLFGLRIIDTPTLRVPHPRMWEREFVMQPLREICADAWLDEVRAAVAAERERD